MKFRLRDMSDQAKGTIMSKIIVEHHPSQERLTELGVSSWSTWSKEVSTFPWTYSEQEVAYVLEGECRADGRGHGHGQERGGEHRSACRCCHGLGHVGSLLWSALFVQSAYLAAK